MALPQTAKLHSSRPILIKVADSFTPARKLAPALLLFNGTLLTSNITYLAFFILHCGIPDTSEPGPWQINLLHH